MVPSYNDSALAFNVLCGVCVFVCLCVCVLELWVTVRLQ